MIKKYKNLSKLALLTASVNEKYQGFLNAIDLYIILVELHSFLLDFLTAFGWANTVSLGVLLVCRANNVYFNYTSIPVYGN